MSEAGGCSRSTLQVKLVEFGTARKVNHADDDAVRPISSRKDKAQCLLDAEVHAVGLKGLIGIQSGVNVYGIVF